MKTAEEYKESLRKMRPNIYKFGKLIEDVTTDPATKRTVESHSRCFAAGYDPEYEEIFTTTSKLTGEKIFRFNSLMMSEEDVIANSRMKRTCYRLTGTCTGAVCVGWNCQNVMYAVTQDIDKEFGTDYHERLKKWILYAQENSLAVSGALTDAKGDRSKKPSQQEDLDTNIRVVEKREDGIVIRGAKVMICGVAAANEIFILPGGVYGESDKDFAVACVVPRDIEGLTIIETTRPSDLRELKDNFDMPKTGITQAYLIFDDVFVPNERVFMCGEYKYTRDIITYFTSTYRACIGACVAGQGDVMIGASVLMARANGLASKIFMDKLIAMSINNEVTYGLGIGAIALGKQHSSGVYFPDPLLANANKVQVATLPYETKRLAQEIGGGIVETGCLPAYEDIEDPKYGDKIKKYLKAGQGSGITRAKIARLVEWLTLGAGVPGTMHGGGSPDGARLFVRLFTPFEKYVEYAKKIMDIDEDLQEPQKKK
ncbi:4-hydroxyphenylacetate 3-hydroxylase N-terminal domain-containing protein [Hippea alviniae]|uniref:4-hydroxyphenylacetate 3-hydroxylase N-terminal domain-containing protein n=1 Tax=Hippea alviniae TaxID=1279027 RepID=UPI000410742F|nr:4-hydroxyphenylacetate 3-hydroxylase N-terminal domain-containing protein [Hippea alviniae]